MNFFVKKIRLFLIIFLVFLLIIFLFFYKKVTKTKIETKLTQLTSQIENVKETIAPEPTKILSDNLPNKHLIKTAFVKQSPKGDWNQPWQDACEEASLLTIDYFYKNITPTDSQIESDIFKMINYETKLGFGNSINVDQMFQIATDYLKYQTKIINNPTIEDFKKYLNQEIPIMVPAAGKILFQENKHFNAGGPYYHNLVILGYDDDKKQFIVHDVGTKSGANFHYSYQLLMESIHDLPTSSKVEEITTGPKNVLVLLK